MYQTGNKLILPLALIGILLVQNATAFVMATNDGNQSLQEDHVDGNIAWSIEDDTLTLSKADGKEKGEMNKYTKTSRPTWESDENWGNVTKVIINEGVTTVGEWAFRMCASITSITLPSGITSIGTDAFVGCSLLSTVNIPDSVTFIGAQAFSRCSSITEITIPAEVTSVGNYTFRYCKSLSSVTFTEGGDKITTIGDSAFEGCIALTTISIPEKVTAIGKYAFSESGLTSVTIPDGQVKEEGGEPIMTVGTHAFNKCSALTSVTIGTHLKTIEPFTFEYCTSLTTVDFNGESELTTIGEYSFRGCSALESITIPNTVTKIGVRAFMSSGLTSIEFPASITDIGDGAFEYCQDLETIKFGDAEDVKLGAYLFDLIDENGNRISRTFYDTQEEKLDFSWGNLKGKEFKAKVDDPSSMVQQT